ncbi:MAG: SAM-dependent methyltransferase [Oligoflexales bacterium]
MTQENTNARPSHGTLILAGNALSFESPIPADSLAVVRSSHLLVFEEDRVARHVLKNAGLHRDYIKYNEHKSKDSMATIQEALQAGQTVCYMSDCGMPNLADPGKELLELAYRSKVKVRIIPGPSSVTAALAACPFSIKQFRYVGFLPQKQEERQRELTFLSKEKIPLVVLDTPYRLASLLKAFKEAFSQQRKALLALDITGPDEEFRVGNLQSLAAYAEQLQKKLNFVLVVDSN